MKLVRRFYENDNKLYVWAIITNRSKEGKFVINSCSCVITTTYKTLNIIGCIKNGKYIITVLYPKSRKTGKIFLREDIKIPYGYILNLVRSMIVDFPKLFLLSLN